MVGTTSDKRTTGHVPPVTNISLQELEKHGSPSDCWIAIDGNVYDVTDYWRSHPGGVLILAGAGTDATVMFHHYHIGMMLQ